MSKPLKRSALAACLVLWAAAAAAQTVLDPRYAEFDASDDHAAQTTTGQPLVTRYDLEFYFSGAPTPFQTNSLGKPTPNSSGVIRVDLNATLTAFPPPGTTYEARIAAIGPTGTGRSTVSNPFAFTDPCASSIAPTGTSLGGAAGTGTVAVTIAAGCSWTASSSAAWVTLTGTAGGSGTGSIGYSVAANTTTSVRTGYLAIAGHAFAITQAAGCTFAVSPTSVSITSSARTGTVAVTAGTGCGWTAESAASWITVTSGSSGSGNGSVAYSIAANTSTSSRTGAVTIAGRTFTVTQAGVPCTTSLSPGGVSVESGGAAGTIAVSSPSGCAWTASDDAPWVTITSGGSGTGSGTVAYSVAVNPNTTERTATITVADQSFAITQTAVVCSLSISPTASSPTDAGGNGTVAVSANAASCPWTATSNASWMTVTSGASGTGSGSVSYTVARNTSTTGRTGTMTIAGQTLTVTQGAAPCTYGISPTLASLGPAASSNAIAVTALGGCSWTATESASWLSLTGGASGSGNGTVTYSVTANPTITLRSATITVAGQSFTVAQAGETCTHTLTPTGASVAAAGSTGSVSVTSLAGCAWTASSAAAWVTITGGSSGSGSGTVSYSAAANLTTSPRTGTLTIGGQPFTVTQGGGACAYATSPDAESFGAPGGTGSITMTALAGCSWGATTTASWIAITGGATGSGGGTIAYQVAANADPSPRSGTIAAGGRVVTISQAAAPCSYTLTPAGVSVEAASASGSFAVSASASCSWTASSNAAWLTLPGATSGNGSGTIGYSASANTTVAARTATVTVAGRAFTVTQAAPVCSFTLSTTSLSMSSTASTGTVSLTAGSGCSWTAVSSASWITVTAGGAGSGNGTVGLAVAVNTSNTARTGTVTIAGQTVTVTQQGVACTTSITPLSVSTPYDATTGTAAVVAADGCSWTAVSNVAWVTVDSGANGTGSGTVGYSVAANPTAASRSGTLTIGTRTLFVSQAARSCTFALNPSSLSIGGDGTTDTFDVTATAGCGWTATTSASWIAIVSGGVGTGDGSVTFSATPNPTTAIRSGTISVAGRLFRITQAGTCSYSLTPLSVSVGTGAASSTVYVSAGAGCSWSAVSETPWITVTSGQSGTGSGSVSLSTAANSASSSRSDTVTIAGQTFIVNQSGCSYNVSPTAMSVGAGGMTSNASISTSAPCPWSGSSNDSWITLPNTTSGTGTSLMTYTVAANPGTSPRTGTLTLAGRTITINQAAAPCTYAVTPTSVTVSNAGGNASITVASPSTCFWSASNPAAWVTIASGQSGAGDGTVVLQIAPYASNFSRAATLNVAGRLVFLTQRPSPAPKPPANVRIVVP